MESEFKPIKNLTLKKCDNIFVIFWYVFKFFFFFLETKI